eukprot:CAMPEP_0184682294 /NCGR_PEP_ID=MMETSP0312-20130426/6680_1 /TAXON_ID=31354 /ORGANISM="Compsopogon coeruleus, Strain SAG 36.94" /LENGTH=469 /DNA_ID=CAMNT_0027133865 /DNA_START=1 /DNA_END=1410 /DNA_ORIENTATION=-
MDLEHVPVYRPSWQEFRYGDITEYARSVRDLLYAFGAVRVDPPAEFKWPVEWEETKAGAAIKPRPVEADEFHSTSSKSGLLPEETAEFDDHSARINSLVQERQAFLQLTGRWFPPPSIPQLENHLWSTDLNASPNHPSRGGPLTELIARHGSCLLSSLGGSTSPIDVVREAAMSCLRMNRIGSLSPWRVDQFTRVSFIHGGSRNIWYVVAPADCADRNITDCSPRVLHDAGVRVRRVYQKPGSFVLVAPGAWSRTISAGLTLSEEIRVVTLEWLTLETNCIASDAHSNHFPREAILICSSKRRLDSPGFQMSSPGSKIISSQLEKLIRTEFVALENARRISSFTEEKEISENIGEFTDLELLVGPICFSCRKYPYLFAVKFQPAQASKSSCCLHCLEKIASTGTQICILYSRFNEKGLDELLRSYGINGLLSAESPRNGTGSQRKRHSSMSDTIKGKKSRSSLTRELLG